MARIRTIKPEFFTSEDIVGLSPIARLLYIALWCECDRAGRLSWKPRTFRLRYLPADDVDIGAVAQELIDGGLVVLYGEGLAFIPTFERHQHINPREAQSVLPEPDHDAIHDASARVSDASARVHAPSLTRMEEGKGKEGKGKEDALPASQSKCDRPKLPACPGQAILDLWADILPELPQPAVWNDARSKPVQCRWREMATHYGWQDAEAGIDWFRRLFTQIKRSAFLMGKTPPAKDRRQFVLQFDWLFKQSNFVKVIEGWYHEG